MDEKIFLAVRLWQPLTGGGIHWSLGTPEGVHLASICGFDLVNYVVVKSGRDWTSRVSCKECRGRMRFFWPGVVWPDVGDLEALELVKGWERVLLKKKP